MDHQYTTIKMESTPSSSESTQRKRRDSETVALAMKTLQEESLGSNLNQREMKTLKRSFRKFSVQQCCIEDVEGIYGFLEGIARKFTFSIETVSIGMYFYNKLFTTQPQRVGEYKEKGRLYSSVCLMVAAKAVEFDYIIPTLARYQRHADASYQKQEYERKEVEVMMDLGFDVQVPTFHVLLSHYLDGGILGEAGRMEGESVVERVREKSAEQVRSGEFLNQNQPILALRILMEVAHEMGERWSLSPQEQPRFSKFSFTQQQKLFIIKFNKQNSRTLQSKIDFSEKLAERISKQNNHLKVTSIPPFRPLEAS